jgi:hypothetical protein
LKQDFAKTKTNETTDFGVTTDELRYTRRPVVCRLNGLNFNNFLREPPIDRGLLSEKMPTDNFLGAMISMFVSAVTIWIIGTAILFVLNVLSRIGSLFG